MIAHGADEMVRAELDDVAIFAELVDVRREEHPVHEDRDQFDNPFLKHFVALDTRDAVRLVIRN